MKPRRLHLSVFFSCMFLGLLPGTDLYADENAFPAKTADSARVEFFPIPRTQRPQYSDMVIDPDNRPWVMANNKLFYWTGEEFREPISGPMPSGQYLAGLYGGPDRGAYATTPGTREHEGWLYRLRDGMATVVTSFYYEVGHEYPGIYVSRSGTVFNWGYRFLARLGSLGWDRTEALLSLRDTRIFDLGDAVFFYYDNRLYRAGEDGFQEMKPPRWHEARPGSVRITGVLWGESRALLVKCGEQCGLFAFDIPTCQEVPLETARNALRTVTLFDAFSHPDGSVWLLGNDPADSSYSFYRLDPHGMVERTIALRDIPWNNMRYWQFPESVRVTSSGAIVFGLPKDGLAVWQDGQMRRYGWQHGLATEVRHVLEDAHGHLWAPAGASIARFQLEALAASDASAFEDWEEHRLASRTRMWEVGPGHLAMFRIDKPGVLSRWDGKRWSFQPVPFDPEKIGRTMVDDRGHLILAMSADPDGKFDVGPDAVVRYDTLEALLREAVRQGAKYFDQYDGFQGVVATSNRIWYGYRGYNRVILAEDEGTDVFSFGDNIYNLYPSALYGALFRSQGERIYRYDRGQMVEVPPPLREVRLLMLGPNGLQPYERELVLRKPTLFYPVLQEGSRQRLFFDADDFESAGETSIPHSSSLLLQLYMERIVPSSRGGAWVEYLSGAGNATRIFANRPFELDLSESPISDCQARRVREDASGNLWLEPYAPATPNRVFMRKLDHVRLKLVPPAKRCGRQARFKVKISPARYAAEFQGLARISKADWFAMETNSLELSLRFPTSGVYTVEIGGLVMGSRLRSSPSFTVSASVELPDTHRTDSSDDEIVVDDPFWTPPVQADKTANDAQLGWQWRIDGAPWQRSPLDAPLHLSRIGAGKHVVEIAAEEDGFWSDPTPVSIAFQYAPDYGKAVNQRVQILLNGDEQAKKQAGEELIQLGSIATEPLRCRLEQAEAESRLVNQLRHILSQMNAHPAPEW